MVEESREYKSRFFYIKKYKKRAIMENILDKVEGFEIKAIKAGIKASGKLDLGMIVAKDKAVGAGVFTLSKVVAAPVTLSKKTLEKNSQNIKAILVNAGNANACTGEEGMDNAKAVAEKLAGMLGVEAEQILLCSTGIIGEQLPMEKFISGVEKIVGSEDKCGAEFTEAILTTDLVKKEAAVELSLGSIAGVCKGSGMIAPNMATMLGFVITDINIAQELLDSALKEVVDLSFNAVTVDSDTSTNDTVLLLSSCCKGEKITSKESPEYKEFRDGLYDVCFTLAEKIAIDGEGATKVVRVNVKGAKTLQDAKLASRSIAESPLVKTAMFGCDPNWGRVIMALGKSGCDMEEAKTDIALCAKTLLLAGTPQKFDAEEVSKLMANKDISIDVDLHLGSEKMTMLTCDFSYDYVKINAEYHT